MPPGSDAWSNAPRAPAPARSEPSSCPPVESTVAGRGILTRRGTDRAQDCARHARDPYRGPSCPRSLLATGGSDGIGETVGVGIGIGVTSFSSVGPSPSRRESMPTPIATSTPAGRRVRRPRPLEKALDCSAKTGDADAYDVLSPGSSVARGAEQSRKAARLHVEGQARAIASRLRPLVGLPIPRSRTRSRSRTRTRYPLHQHRFLVYVNVNRFLLRARRFLLREGATQDKTEDPSL